MPLTQEQKDDYLEEGSHCPKCGEADFEGGSFQTDSNVAWQHVTCVNCGFEWDDIYKLVDIEDKNHD